MDQPEAGRERYLIAPRAHCGAVANNGWALIAARGKRRMIVIQRQRIRVGVIGMYQSGKTVLLTSLINHLRNHKPECLSLGTGDAEIGFLEDGLGLNKGFDKFRYPDYRHLLGNESWPSKTLACSQYHCRVALRQQGKRVRRIDLTLTDMAGERLADLSMAGCDYAQWSDATLALLNTQEYSRHAAEYLELLERPDATMDQILTSYRRVLAELILHFLPVVSPSTFLLDQDGKYAVEPNAAVKPNADSLVAKRVSGLDAAHQFAPCRNPSGSGHPSLRPNSPSDTSNTVAKSSCR